MPKVKVRKRQVRKIEALLKAKQAKGKTVERFVEDALTVAIAKAAKAKRRKAKPANRRTWKKAGSRPAAKPVVPGHGSSSP